MLQPVVALIRLHCGYIASDFWDWKSHYNCGVINIAAASHDAILYLKHHWSTNSIFVWFTLTTWKDSYPTWNRSSILTFGSSRHGNFEDRPSEKHPEAATLYLWTSDPCSVSISGDATHRTTWNSSSAHSPPKRPAPIENHITKQKPSSYIYIYIY